MNRNVRKGESLVYEKKKKVFYLKVISKEIGTSKPIFFEIGEKGENNKEMQLPSGMSKRDLEDFAKDYHKGIINKKCTGSFDSWGIPRTKAGDTADITTPNFPDSSRNGKYIIESVKITLSASDGFKRTNTLGVMLYK